MREIMRDVLDCLEKKIPAALATIVEARGSTPGRVGGRMLVFGDGNIKGTVGGGRLEGQVIQEGLETLKTGRASLLRYELTEKESTGLGMICGGGLQVFVEPLLPQPHLIIAGGGHIAQSLCPLAKMLDYTVTVIDDRKEFVNRQMFPTADYLEVGDIPQTLKSMDVHSLHYIIIVTRGHGCDEEALHAVIESKAAYLGMIGSPRKVINVFKNLQEKGVSREDLARVKAPIGLDIGGNSPVEISFSIMAQVQQVRYKKESAEGFKLPFSGKCGGKGK